MDTNESQEKLEALKHHSLFPFTRWSEDVAQYAHVELYWTYLFYSVVAGNAWKPWHPRDRTGEGNPIFSAVHLDYGRGVRVIQRLEHKPDEERYFGFQPFLSLTPAEPYNPDQTVLELCFLANISEQTEALCRSFWRRFCIELAPERDIEEAIRRYEDEVGMPSWDQI